MDRFCIRHSHRGSSRAYRLILARHSLDGDAHRQVVDEHGDCGHCWRDTPLALAHAAHPLLIGCGRLPGMVSAGNVSGLVVDGLFERTESALACEDADRLDLPG